MPAVRVAMPAPVPDVTFPAAFNGTTFTSSVARTVVTFVLTLVVVFLTRVVTACAATARLATRVSFAATV
jgi:hypothetical protein